MTVDARPSDWRQWTVAVTGMNAKPENPGPGLAVARCLRDSPGFVGNIVGLSYDAMDAGLYFRGVSDASYLLPYPATGVDALWERLRDIHAVERIDAIIPCLDTELANFAVLTPDLEAMGIRLLSPSRAQISEMLKDRLPDLCRRLKIPVPQTRAVDRADFFDWCPAEGWTYPLVVKGVFYDAIIVTNPVQAKAAFHKIQAEWGNPILVQKFLAGRELNLTAVGDGNGGLLAPVMMRKCALTDKGKAWAGIAIEDHALEAMAIAVVSALNWSGPLEIEAMYGYDGQLYLIEINPRFPAWVYLTHGVGRNRPVLLLRLLAGESVPEPPPPHPGTLFIRHAQELIVSLDDYAAMLVGDGLCSEPAKPLDPSPLGAKERL